MFNKNAKINILEHCGDHEGRYIICNIEIDNTKYTICNVYAPNEDNPNFFRNLLKKVDKMSQEYVIIGGDFNLTLEPKLDRLNSMINNYNAAKVLKTCIEEEILHDVWRDRNPDKERYTWFRKKANGELSASRLDYFLVNTGLLSQIDDITISAMTRTDHSMVSLKINNMKYRRGPGIWKMNTTILKDEIYQENICKIIKEVEHSSGVSKISRWEYCKNRISKYSQEYTREKVKKKPRCLVTSTSCWMK